MVNENKPDKINPSELLKMAKGTDRRREVIMMEMKSKLLEVPENRKRMLMKRRDTRRGVFQIRKMERLGRGDKLPPALLVLKEIIGEQLDPNLGLSWETFSHKWDIHPSVPTQIVTEEQWFNAGGTVDPEFGNVKDPTAFTKQD